MSEITCHIIDYIFTDMVQQFTEVEGLSTEKIASFKESLEQIDEIKVIIRKYFSWAVGWFNAKRLKPVIAHYYQLINDCHISDAACPCLIFAISDELAAKSMAALDDLKSLNQRNPNTAINAIECLIEVIDIGVTKLLKEPKELLKFNFIANKTLDGVINMTTALSYKSLRKLGRAMDSTLYQTAAVHLQQFIIPCPLNWCEAGDTGLV